MRQARFYPLEKKPEKDAKKATKLQTILDSGKITKDATNSSDSSNLISLKDILLSQPKPDEIETYCMQPDPNGDQEEAGFDDKSLIINRMPLLFDN